MVYVILHLIIPSMKTDKLVQICDRAIKYSFYLLFLLVPLVMTPWNFELFEYNKMMFTYALTTVIVGTWAIKMLVKRQLVFRHTPFDIPITIYLITQLLSTLFSIDRHTSIWGYYSRFHGGLLSTFSYLLLYFALVSNLDKQKILSALRYLLYAATLVALYGIAEHFGIDAQYWVQDVRNRVFSTLGQPNWLAAWIAALMPLTLTMIILERQKRLSLFFYSSTFLLLILTLFYTNSRSGKMAAMAVLILLALWLVISRISTRKFLLPGIFLTVIIGLVVGKIFWQKNAADLAYIFGLTNQIQIAPYQSNIGGSESTDIRKIVWRGAMDIGKHYPLFGSGVETFAYSYYRFRPVQHNLVSEWDFLYNKAHNEYLNFWATTGAFGLGSYLLLIGWIIWWNLRKLKIKSDFELWTLNFGLFSGWLSILVTNFVGFSVVPIALFFFLFPAFAVVLIQKEHSPLTSLKKTSITNYQLLITIFILFTISYLLFTIFKFWWADVAFAKGQRLGKQGEYAQSLRSLQKAINLNPHEPNYYDEFAWTTANLAVLAFEKKDSSLSANLASLAVASSNQAITISPKHLNFWKTRAKVFYKLAQVDTNFLQKALETLTTASQLAPTDAKVFYNLGLVQEAIGQNDQALKTLEKTVELKNNYADARYALALLYQQGGQRPKAIEQLEYILEFIQPGDTEVLQKLKEWKR